MPASFHVATTNAVEFVLDEARLLNDGRYADWLALFAPHGHYWVPLQGDRQSDPLNYSSIAYEDKLLLETRIRRLQGAQAHSLQPGVRGFHLLQQPRVEPASDDANEVQLYTPFLYTETRGERQYTLTGAWRHRLRTTPSGFEILLKRVDLLNAAAAHEAIQLFP